MKTSLLAIGTAFMLAFFLSSSPAFSDEPTAGNTESRYAYGIDKEIANCQAKIELKNSRSANLQREAAKAFMKASYLKAYKHELIADMKREGIGTKDYQISNFLNDKFLELVTPVLAGNRPHAEPLVAVEK